jgi:hypothetical protein
MVGGDGRRDERRTKFQFIFLPIVTPNFEGRFLSLPLGVPKMFVARNSFMFDSTKSRKELVR